MGLGLAVPRGPALGWSVVALAPFCFGTLTMGYELIKGKAKARRISSHLSKELGIDGQDASGRAVLEAAVMRASIHQQFIYRFHARAFAVGVLIVALPMLLAAIITYAIR